MKLIVRDIRFVLALLHVNMAYFFTFTNTKYFWPIYTIVCLLLIGYTIMVTKLDKKQTLLPAVGYGLISGLLLYSLFWIGNALIGLLGLPFKDEITNLYSTLSPSSPWHYVALCIIVIPGEELFWRGVIHDRLARNRNQAVTLLISTLLYTFPMLYSGNSMLIVAGIFGGACWGLIYYWKKSIYAAIISHLVFDLMLLVIAPFQ